MSLVLNYKCHIFSASLVAYTMVVAYTEPILTLFPSPLFHSLLIFEINSQINYQHKSLFSSPTFKGSQVTPTKF